MQETFQGCGGEVYLSEGFAINIPIKSMFSLTISFHSDGMWLCMPAFSHHRAVVAQ